MSNRKLVFIVGAGANKGKELNFPDGAELVSQIGGLYEPKPDRPIPVSSVNDVLTKLFQQSGEQDFNRFFEKYSDVAAQIFRAMPNAKSIDQFINDRGDQGEIVYLSKLAIAIKILEHEESTLFKVNRIKNKHIDLRTFRNHWYNKFFQLVIGSEQEIRQNLRNIAVVIFNYDRCFEMYLREAIRNYLNTGVDKASEIVKELEIIHPYGVVGNLDWISQENVVEFGADRNEVNLMRCVDQIRTFSESVHGELESKIRAIVRNAEVLVFLGFGFIDLNMKLLAPFDPKGKKAYTQQVFATRKSIGKENWEIIENAISRRFHVKKMSLGSCSENEVCEDLFDRFKLRLEEIIKQNRKHASK